jgi:uncharacterized RDD family membrane protein YckC
MSAVRISTQFTLTVALWIFALAALWLTAVPDTLGSSTYVSIAALLTALAAITMKSTMSDQTPGALARLIHGSTPRTD